MEENKYRDPKAHAVHSVKLGYMAVWFKVYYPEVFYKVTLNRYNTGFNGKEIHHKTFGEGVVVRSDVKDI